MMRGLVIRNFYEKEGCLGRMCPYTLSSITSFTLVTLNLTENYGI